MIELRPAHMTDLLAIEGLLDEFNLVFEGVDENISDFFVLSMNQNIIGCIGLEVFNTVALLRSFAVRSRHQKQGYGLLLLRKIETAASCRGIHQLFLLTNTARGFFDKYGYAVANRSDAPKAIASTREFSELCPESSTFMQKEIRVKKNE